MKTRFNSFWLAALALMPWPAPAQNSGVVNILPPRRTVAKRNAETPIALQVQLKNGYHVNSNKPADDYLIPLRLTCDAKPLELAGVDYPAPKMEKYDFSKKPLSVFTGDFSVTARLRAPANAPGGPAIGLCKLRYQACTNTMCLPPKSVDVTVPLSVE